MKLHQTLLASVALMACMGAQAQTVSIVPSLTEVAIGASFSLDVTASGFPDKIFGGGYNLAFDPTILRLDDITFPASWEFLVSKGTPDAAAGTVTDIFFNTFTNPIAGDFLTASLKFTAIGGGTSAVTLTESPSFPFGNDLGEAVAVSYVGATVTAVPEPSSIALALAGIACIGWMGRRRHDA